MAVAAMTCSIACGQGTSDDSALRAWVDAQRQSDAWALLSAKVIEFEQIIPPQTTDAELDAMRARAAGRPDHPDHQVVEAEERRRANGGDKTSYTIYAWGPGNCRICRNTPAGSPPDVAFIDVTLRDGVWWQLTPLQLAIIDPGNIPEGRDYSRVEYAIETDLAAALTSSLARVKGDPKLSAKIAGQTWTLQLEAADRTDEWRGGWAEGPGGDRSPVARRREITRHPDSAFIGEHQEYANDSFEPELNRWVHRTVTFFSPKGPPERTIRLISIRPLTRAEFENVTAIPVIGSADPIRGKVAITRLFDFRPASMQISFPDDPSKAPIALPDQSPNNVALRAVGWTVAAAILVALVWVRWRRHITEGSS